jgi:hypothetical protein
MINFRTYLTELFDRTFELEKREYAGYERQGEYIFVVQEKGGRLLPVPLGGAALDRWVDENYDGDTPTVYTYVVNFTEISWFKGEYAEFALFYGIENTEGIYELGFDRRGTELRRRRPQPKPVGSPPKDTSTYFWSYVHRLSTDEDLNWLGAGDASSVIGTVVEAAKRFVKETRPRGIVIGTKANANPARGRIYKALARRAATATNGTVYDTAMARGDMAAPAIVWFDKGKNPFKGHA